MLSPTPHSNNYTDPEDKKGQGYGWRYWEINKALHNNKILHIFWWVWMISSRTSLGRTPRDRWYFFCEFVLTYFITSEYNYFSNRHTNRFLLQRKILSHTNSLTRLVWNKWVTREVLQNENAYKLSFHVMKCETRLCLHEKFQPGLKVCTIDKRGERLHEDSWPGSNTDMPPKVHFYSPVWSRESVRAKFASAVPFKSWREIRTEVRLYDFLDPGWFQPSPWGEGWKPGAKFQPGSSAMRHVNAPFILCTWRVEIWPGSNSTRVETLHVNTAFNSTNFRNFGRETCRDREMNSRTHFREIRSWRTCTWLAQTTKMCRTQSSYKNSYTLSQGLSRNFVRIFVLQNLSTERFFSNMTATETATEKVRSMYSTFLQVLQTDCRS